MEFYKAIATFKGASKRLQVLRSTQDSTVWLDFAHAPSKVKATIDALKMNYPNRKLIAILELHTFSSLTSGFLEQYSGSMDKADIAIVYYNPETLKHKRLPELQPGKVKASFARSDLKTYINSLEMINFLKTTDKENTNILFMSSGNYDGIDLHELAKSLI